MSKVIRFAWNALVFISIVTLILILAGLFGARDILSKPDNPSPRYICDNLENNNIMFPLLKNDTERVKSILTDRTNTTITSIEIRKVETQYWEMREEKVNTVTCQAFYDVCMRGEDEYFDKCFPSVIGRQLEIRGSDWEDWRK